MAFYNQTKIFIIYISMTLRSTTVPTVPFQTKASNNSLKLEKFKGVTECINVSEHVRVQCSYV